MKSELDIQLCERYPKIFRDRHADMQYTAMCWGFDCGDGWYELIDALCANIQNHIDSTRSQRAIALRYNRALRRAQSGDLNGLINYHNFGDLDCAKNRAQKDIEYGAEPRLVNPSCEQVVATQVKEKIGTLRFYYNGGDDTIHGMVRMAESLSARLCEVCGSPGKLYGDSWITTRCRVHADENT